jgi:hypothetical protein
VKSEVKTSSVWLRLVMVGLIAGLAGWGVNQWVVWRLSQYTPPARAEQGAASADQRDDHGGPRPEPASPEPASPEPASPEPVDDPPARAVEARSDAAEPSPQPRPAASSRPESPSRTKPERRSPPAAADDEDGDDDAIRVFSVDDKKLGEQVDDLEQLGAHGRVLPHIEDGQRRGMRFVEVAPGGVFAQLGIRRGDVILSVNGEDLTTQQDALDNFEKMRQMRTFDVALVRDGERRHHRYILKRPHREPTD